MKDNKRKTSASGSAGTKESRLVSQQSWVWIFLISILVLLIYAPVWNFGITNWDEKYYLLESGLVRDFSQKSIPSIFTEKVLGSYNPLVLLSFGLELKVFGLGYGGMHGVNVVLHLFNGLLLFTCLRKLGLPVVQSGLAAALFAVHPMQTEAVAWLASRKDVLYTFFYFLAWYTYLRFARSEKSGWLVAAIVLFTLSLLSKAQAVTLPLILILTDYYLYEEWKWKRLLNKIPFFLLSIGFGLFAVYGSSFSADKYATALSFSGKLFYSIIAFGTYIQKFLFPLGQSVIYDFPGTGSFGFIAGLVPGIILLFGFFYLIFRNFGKHKILVLGSAFFMVTIFLTLHIIAVNSSLIYERFTYVACIGLILLLSGDGKENPGFKKYRITILAIIIPVFSVLAHQRTQVWKSTLSLWSDTVKKNPEAFEAYNNRGSYFEERGELQKAAEDYRSSIRVNPTHPDAYNNLSVIWFKMNNLDSAFAANEIALSIAPDYPQGLTNRGILFFNKQEYDSAIYYYNRAISVMPVYPFAIRNRGSAYLQMGKYDDAIQDYNLSLKYSPKSAETYKYKGIAYIRKGDLQAAETEMRRAQSLDQGSDAIKVLSDEYVNKGALAFREGLVDSALALQQKAIEIYSSNAEAWYQVGGIYFSRRDFIQARKNWEQVLRLNPQHKGANEWLPRVPSN